MQVLFLMPRVCWPPQTGLMLRNYYLARELARAGAQVTLLSFADDQVDFSERSGLPREMLPPPPEEWGVDVLTVQRDPSYTTGKIARGVLGKTPITALNYTTPAMRSELRHVLKARAFDLVQVETSTLTDYLSIIKAAPGSPVSVCDWHNIDSELMQRYSEQASPFGRRVYARITAHRMLGFEQNVLRKYDAHIAVSERDAIQLRQKAPTAQVKVIENGVDTNYYADEKIEQAYEKWLAANDGSGARPSSSARFGVLFVGSMDYHANVDAVVNFTEQSWPEIHARWPDLRFTIVGRNPTKEVLRLVSAGGVEVTGTVPDVRPYYHGAAVQLVPLRVGGGSRLKILEAMAAGVPVISTTLGAEGLSVTDERDISVANNTAETMSALERVMKDQLYRTKLIQTARQLVKRKYDWSVLGVALHESHQRLLQQFRNAGVASVRQTT